MRHLFLVSLTSLFLSAIALTGSMQAAPVSPTTASGLSTAMDGPRAQKSMVVKVQRWKRGRGWRGRRGFRRGRAHRRWKRRRHYGNIIGGIVLGAIIAGAARHAYRPDDDELCWYWTDRYRTHGYWDYCY